MCNKCQCEELKNKHLGKGLATIGVCLLGAAAMYLSGGVTGVGWAILGCLFIWG